MIKPLIVIKNNKNRDKIEHYVRFYQYFIFLTQNFVNTSQSFLLFVEFNLFLPVKRNIYKDDNFSLHNLFQGITCT